MRSCWLSVGGMWTSTSLLNQCNSFRDEELSTKCGWDAVIYLRFQRYLMLLTAGAGILSLCVALPVNFQDDLGEHLTYKTNLQMFLCYLVLLS